MLTRYFAELLRHDWWHDGGTAFEVKLAEEWSAAVEEDSLLCWESVRFLSSSCVGVENGGIFSFWPCLSASVLHLVGSTSTANNSDSVSQLKSSVLVWAEANVLCLLQVFICECDNSGNGNSSVFLEIDSMPFMSTSVWVESKIEEELVDLLLGQPLKTFWGEKCGCNLVEARSQENPVSLDADE